MPGAFIRWHGRTMIRPYNFDEEIVAVLDAEEKGSRSKLARKAMRIGLQQLGYLGGQKKEESINENLIELVKRLVREEIQGLRLAPEIEEKVNEEAQKKIQNLTQTILKSRK